MISSTSTRIAGGRAKFAIFLICLVGGVELTLASRSCKRTVMEIVKRQCGETELRLRRDTAAGLPKRIMQADLGSAIISVLAQAFTGYLGKLIMSMGPSLGFPAGPLSAATSLLSGRRRRALPTYETNSLPTWMIDDFGMDLTIGELEELYNGIFEGPYRPSSTHPIRAKAVFLDIAAKCCGNKATCLREKITYCP